MGFRMRNSGELEASSNQESAQISKLRELIQGKAIDQKNKLTNDAAAQENELAQASHKADLEQQAVDANLGRGNEQATSMGIPKGKYAINANQSGFSINPEPSADPLSKLLQRQTMNDKMLDNQRMETSALQGEFKKLGGNDPDKLRSYDDVLGSLDDVNVNNVGQLRAQLARGVEKGVLTDQDIARYLPSTAMGDAKKLAAYLGMGAGDLGQAITPEQKENIKKDITSKRANILKTQQAASTELQGRAGMLAPTLKQNGQLNQVMGSLGGVAKQAASPQGPTEGGLSPQEQQELNMLRQKHGR